MTPVILSFDCVDHDPIEEWEPDDAFDVDFWMNFTIGPDATGGDNFQVHIVTPNNLHGKDSDRHAIVMLEYSWPSVLAEVEGMLEKCQGSTWLEMSEELSRLMHWEYDNYKP